MPGFFWRLGRLAGPAVRKGKWLWTSLTGTEEELLKAEEAVGGDLDRAFREAMVEDRTEELRHRVTEVGKRLAGKVKNKKRRFFFTIVSDAAPNAFALPGGYVYVTSGLCACVGENEDELAFVLAHEMAHILRQDPMQRIVTEAAVETAVKALSRRIPAASWAHCLGAKLLRSSYSQDRELEADRLGVRLARAAGFAPEAALTMLERLREEAQRRGGSADFLGPYFSTHPRFELRCRHIRQVLAGR